MLEHVLDPGSVVPECTATADNYYVREGALLTSADVVQAGDLVQQAYAEGRTGVQMRCTSYDSYVQLKSLLFDVLVHDERRALLDSHNLLNRRSACRPSVSVS